MINRSHILLVHLFILTLFATSALSEGYKIEPFALYEQAESNIVIDGVSTKYALGVAGVQVHKTFNQSLTISSRLGYGQNNNQKTSFSGATFNGKVTGTYLSLGGKYQFYKRDGFAIFSLAQITRRSLKASNLVGKRNNLDLTGSSDTQFNSNDLAIGIALKPTETLSLEMSVGTSNWHIKSNAKGFYSSNGISATAKKSIDTKGNDPVIQATLATNKDNHNFAISISNRSLQSKTSTSVVTSQLSYTFQF